MSFSEEEREEEEYERTMVFVTDLIDTMMQDVTVFNDVMDKMARHYGKIELIFDQDKPYNYTGWCKKGRFDKSIGKMIIPHEYSKKKRENTSDYLYKYFVDNEDSKTQLTTTIYDELYDGINSEFIKAMKFSTDEDNDEKSSSSEEEKDDPLHEFLGPFVNNIIRNVTKFNKAIDIVWGDDKYLFLFLDKVFVNVRTRKGFDNHFTDDDKKNYLAIDIKPNAGKDKYIYKMFHTSDTNAENLMEEFTDELSEENDKNKETIEKLKELHDEESSDESSSDESSSDNEDKNKGKRLNESTENDDSLQPKKKLKST